MVEGAGGDDVAAVVDDDAGVAAGGGDGVVHLAVVADVRVAGSDPRHLHADLVVLRHRGVVHVLVETRRVVVLVQHVHGEVDVGVQRRRACVAAVDADLVGRLLLAVHGLDHDDLVAVHVQRLQLQRLADDRAGHHALQPHVRVHHAHVRHHRAGLGVLGHVAAEEQAEEGAGPGVAAVRHRHLHRPLANKRGLPAVRALHSHHHRLPLHLRQRRRHADLAGGVVEGEVLGHLGGHGGAEAERPPSVGLLVRVRHVEPVWSRTQADKDMWSE